jgi:hypothetical protein
MSFDECSQEYEFPKKIYNRPKLDHVQYRIGKYSEFRKYLMRELYKSEALKRWTHLSGDDPAFALLEGACMLCDILTFYQELYANEAYLRTAIQKESISDLVKLIGYQLSPGLGGIASFAIAIKGDKAVTLSSKLPIKVEIVGIQKPVIFQTSEEHVCFPTLNKFHLYAPNKNSDISGDTTKFYVDDIGVNKLDLPELRSADKILIGEINSTNSRRVINTEIVTIDEVKQVLGKTVFTIKGNLKRTNYSPSAIGFKLGPAHKHFGYNAPPKIVKVNVDTVTESKVDFLEDIDAKGNKKEFPLEAEVEDLPIGSTILIQGFFLRDTWHTNINRKTLTLIRKVSNIRLGLAQKGVLSGPTSIISLDEGIDTNVGPNRFSKFDIRRIQFYKISGIPLTLRAVGKELSENGSEFDFYGIENSAVDSLNGRHLKVVYNDKKIIDTTVTHIDKSLGKLRLDKELDYKDFSREFPTVDIYGNLIEASQGEPQREVLDAGDGRKEFQTFKLSKLPLTYFNSAEETPPERPELTVYVNNHLWKRVPSFFNRKPEDEIYIVRQDVNDNSWIQFGDGKTGRRLPSGLGNVLAQYRIGNAASDKLKEGTGVKPLEKSDIIDEINLFGKVSGGTGAENEINAKEIAPRKIQSLGRLVSVEDYESEARSIPGVIKASADLSLYDETVMIVVKLLVAGGDQEVLKQIEKILLDYDKCRGAQRFPIKIEKAGFQYIYLEIDYGLDPTFRKEIVEQEIILALGVFNKELNDDKSAGIFGIKQRTFGQDEYTTSVEGVVQGVSGVVWVKVRAMFSLGSADDPEDLVIPPTLHNLNTSVICNGNSILRLYHKHLKVNDLTVKISKEC